MYMMLFSNFEVGDVVFELLSERLESLNLIRKLRSSIAEQNLGVTVFSFINKKIIGIVYYGNDLYQ